MFSYLVLRLITLPIPLLSYRTIHRIGRLLGSWAYYLLPKFRKRALSNLALATDLYLSETKLRLYAKESLQNAMITCLEYPKLASETEISRIATCTNPQWAADYIRQGKGLIFLCAHQANWELLFLEGSSRMSGVAIGRPIKNRYLYRWIVSIRQKWGGTIVTPKQAARKGLKALKEGSFLGIVGDQGMPDSGFVSPFFGRRAWTSPLPALLAYRANCPLVAATIKREQERYLIHYSDPIWPNKEKPAEQEVRQMMSQALQILEESIRAAPGQWLWIHNRWKQQVPGKIKRPFRQEALLILLPEDSDACEKIISHLPTLRILYPLEFITVLAPATLAKNIDLPEAEIIPYQHTRELWRRDFRFKLVFNFTPYKGLRRHFLRLSALHVFNLKELAAIAHIQPTDNLSAIFKGAILAS